MNLDHRPCLASLTMGRTANELIPAGNYRVLTIAVLLATPPAVICNW
jgi:hypothetical protein